jgi:hypothetical protein
MSWLYTIFVAGLLFSSGTVDANLPKSDGSSEIAVVSGRQELVEKFDQTYPLNRDGRVSLSNVNGSITIEAWDRNEVRLVATKIADSKESMDLIDISINSRPEYLRIEADYKPWNAYEDKLRSRKAEVQFRLQVPRTAVLSEIEAVNGSVTLSNFVNITKVSAVNGNVIATNLRGTAKLSTVNGELRANFEKIEPGSSVNLETVNGRVNLEVPSDLNATIKADSLNGNISNDFGLPVKKGKYVGRDLHGRIGSGDAPLRLTSVNGSLLINRKKDGKTPSSVTNLLNMTKDDDAEDDDDDDSEEVSEVYTAPPAAVVAKVNKSLKTAERGMKDAEKAVSKVGPQLDKMKMPEMLEMPDVKVKPDKDFKFSFPADAKLPGFPVITDLVWGTRPASVEQRSKTFEVKGAAKVNVNASMCAVRVRGWDQPNVKYVLTEERLAKDTGLQVTENANENTVTIKVTNGGRMPQAEEIWGVENRFRLEVFVPRKTDVSIATEKEIRIEGVNGKIDLDGSDDSVSVRDSEGTLKLNAGNGLIRIVGFKGDLDLETSDAEVYLEGDFARITSCAADANITLTLPSTKGASISTNTAIQSDGLNIVRERDQSWRLGNGGPKYEFNFNDGKLIVRNQANVDVN